MNCLKNSTIFKDYQIELKRKIQLKDIYTKSPSKIRYK